MSALIAFGKKGDNARGRHGAAMQSTGTVAAGTGFIAGGVPGAREPNSLKTWRLKGSSPREQFSRKNLPYNLTQMAEQPRAGILGYRANIHDSWVQTKGKASGGNSYVKGNRAGKLEAEEKIIRGMRRARRVTYPLTIGGTALAIGGGRHKREVGKKDRRGEAGAAVGTAGGLYVGGRGGAEVGVKLANRRIRQQWEQASGEKLPKGSTVVGGDSFVRRAAALSRGLRGGAAAGAVVGGAGGYQLAKRDVRSENTSAAALAGGTAVAGVGHKVPKVLWRHRDRYASSAQQNTLAAQKLAPHFGGLQERPAKYGAFGEVKRPARTTMYPERTDRELRESKAASRIRGGAKTREQVGRHRGLAAQERHFAEVFDSTGKVVRRARMPGLALAGAGAMGLWSSSDTKRRMQRVGKSRAYGYQERRRSPARSAELATGLAIGAWGASRSAGLKGAVAYGARIARAQGSKPEQVEQVMSAARAVARGTRQVTGQGEAHLRRVKALDSAIEKVPSGLRPATAIAAGAILTQHARPVTQQRFTPTGRF